MRIPIDTKTASYAVTVGRGLVATLPDVLREAGATSGAALVMDSTVAELYGSRLRAILGDSTPVLTFPAGEESKNRSTWGRLTDQLTEVGIDRNGLLVAMGGGVTGDLVGFVAATYWRGVRYIQVPTTTLAMIDASVGGKTGLDTDAGKNLVGAFHHPRAVVADIDTLATLPDRILRHGLAEAIKHAAIADGEYLHLLTTASTAVARRDPDILTAIVARSVEIKAGVVTQDEFETGRRAILNFGHTVAHAVETATEYGTPHGEAVAAGLVVEARIGEGMGITEPGTAGALAEALTALELPVGLPPDADPRAVRRAMQFDKKQRDGRPRFALIAKIGEPARSPEGGWTVEVAENVIETALS